MPQLQITLLGTFRIELDNEPVTGLKTNKVRALLAYLAVESARPQPRETLAGLLWRNSTERRARASLSQALYTLRGALGGRHRGDNGEPFILADQDALQFNAAGGHRLDIAAFRATLDAARAAGGERQIELLQEGTRLYQGDFLHGLTVTGCPAFEAWTLLRRERFHRRQSKALGRLVELHEARQAWAPALQAAYRLVELDPWRESAHIAVMRLLARSGRRGEALAHYDTCRRLLAAEQQVAPSGAVERVVEGIRVGKVG